MNAPALVRILAVSGSLRAESSNSRLVRAAARLGLPGVHVIVYDGVGLLPHFSPDLDGDDPPAEVKRLRRLVGEADGLFVSSPEYAHGVPGSFKNALDWLVASLEFPGKPVVLIGGGEHAQAQLVETLRTMSARLVSDELLRGPLLRQGFDAQGELRDPELERSLRASLEKLVEFVRASQV